MEELYNSIFFLEDIIEDYKITGDFESLEELSLKELLDIFDEPNGDNKLLNLISEKLEELRQKRTKNLKTND